MRKHSSRAVSVLLALLLPAAAPAGCFVPDPAGSRLAWIATQKDGSFEGSFRRFEGEVCLDPALPGAGRISLTVYTASVSSGVPELDAALGGDLFLAAERWPPATFRSREIRALGPGRFETRGDFTLRGKTGTLTVPFTFTETEAGARLEGETAIRRLAFDVGLGEWRNTEFLDDLVRLRFSVTLVPAPAQARADTNHAMEGASMPRGPENF
jgi:polyisoprenoid-binding protein YceI